MQMSRCDAATRVSSSAHLIIEPFLNLILGDDELSRVGVRGLCNVATRDCIRGARPDPKGNFLLASLFIESVT